MKIAFVILQFLFSHTILLGQEDPVFYPDSMQVPEGEIVYDNIEGLVSPPEYKGGQDELITFLAKNVKYPEQAIHEGHFGKVFVEFIVETDGSISQLHAIKEVNRAPELTTEVLRVMSMITYEKPAMLLGKPVRFKMVFPINFDPR